MVDKADLPQRPVSYLQDERLSWRDDCKPLKKAQRNAARYAHIGNDIHFAINPENDQVCNGTVVQGDGEAWLTKVLCRSAVAKYTRGAA